MSTDTGNASNGETLDELRERLDGARVAMVTTTDTRGRMSARPLTVQRLGDNGDVFFIVARDADWIAGAQPATVALVDEGRTWVSITGTAEYVVDTSLLGALWDELTDQFFPDRDQAVVMQVHAERWEYWTAPNRVAQMVELAKAYLMDREPHPGDHGVITTRPT